MLLISNKVTIIVCSVALMCEFGNIPHYTSPKLPRAHISPFYAFVIKCYASTYRVATKQKKGRGNEYTPIEAIMRMWVSWNHTCPWMNKPLRSRIAHLSRIRYMKTIRCSGTIILRLEMAWYAPVPFLLPLYFIHLATLKYVLADIIGSKSN